MTALAKASGIVTDRPTCVTKSAESCSCEMWEADSWGRWQFGNPEEGERPPLEAVTKQPGEDTTDWED
jgi:hypothetical protein